MFEITLSAREFDSEARYVLIQNGGILHAGINARDDVGLAIFRMSFPTMQDFIDGMTCLKMMQENR